MPGITDTALYDRPHFDQPVGQADNRIQAALRATADDGPEGEVERRLARVCGRYLTLVDAAFESIVPSHEEASALIALAGVERAALLDASTLARAVRDELVAATAWGVDADVPAKRVAAMSTLECTAIVDVMGRYAGVLGTRYHDAALHAAGARPA